MFIPSHSRDVAHSQCSTRPGRLRSCKRSVRSISAACATSPRRLIVCPLLPAARRGSRSRAVLSSSTLRRCALSLLCLLRSPFACGLYRSLSLAQPRAPLPFLAEVRSYRKSSLRRVTPRVRKEPIRVQELAPRQVRLSLSHSISFSLFFIVNVTANLNSPTGRAARSSRRRPSISPLLLYAPSPKPVAPRSRCAERVVQVWRALPPAQGSRSVDLLCLREGV